MSRRADISPAQRAAGALALGIAAAAAGALALEHLGALALPGCGPASACARAAASVFGRVPLLGWPVSFAGLAWFLGALAAWASCGVRVPFALRALARLAALASAGFVAVMLAGGYVCPYCLAAHAGSLAFWIALERAPAGGGAAPLVALAAVFALVTAGLWLAEREVRARTAAAQEADLAASTREIVAAAGEAPEGSPGDVRGDAPGDAPGTSAYGPSRPFTGRWRLGPERAAVRVVVFSDYQCPDCRRVEAQLAALRAAGLSVSVSMKHFPMCADCNPHTSGKSPHPNACWAARAAEAAGLLGGADAFWGMHAWLFARGGAFTKPVLEQQVRALGLDPARFREALEGPEALARVRADIDEGAALGLHFTPMVFLNGVELRGVFAEDAVRRALEAVLASDPAPATAERDRPASALDKLVGDWREGERVQLPADEHAWWLGPEDAPVEAILWADHKDERTAELDRRLRAWVAANGGVRYGFRHFPFEQGCNAEVSRDGHPGACAAARAAEAAGRLGGPEAFWEMHARLLGERGEIDDAWLARAALELGLEAAALAGALQDPAVGAAIAQDCKAGKPLLYRGAIPTLYVAGRVVPRWRAGEQSALERILAEAAAGR